MAKVVKLYSRISTAQHVANYLLEKSWKKQEEDKNFSVGTVKLNKLVFITFGFLSHFCDRYLFSEEIEAWRYGPVIPSLYHEFKHFGKEPIGQGSYATFQRENELDFSIDIVAPLVDEKKEDGEVLRRIDDVFDSYGPLDAFTLVDITHKVETPWSVTYDGTRNKAIDKKVIKIFYRELCRRNDWK